MLCIVRIARADVQMLRTPEKWIRIEKSWNVEWDISSAKEYSEFQLYKKSDLWLIYATMTQIREHKYGKHKCYTEIRLLGTIFSLFFLLEFDIIIAALDAAAVTFTNGEWLANSVHTELKDTVSRVSCAVEWRYTTFSNIISIASLCYTIFFSPRVPNQSFICTASERISKEDWTNMCVWDATICATLHDMKALVLLLYSSSMQNIP